MASMKYLRRWFVAASVSGPKAAGYALLAVLIPTAIDLSVEHVVTYVPLTPYIPFVVLAATILGWQYAGLVVLASAFIADFWFIGSTHQILEGFTDIFAIACFLIVAVILIAFVEAVRRLVQIKPSQLRSTRGRPGTIVFSLEGGVAWASWYGVEAPVRLGPEEEVATMMEDFLAQRELGRRLLASQQ